MAKVMPYVLPVLIVAVVALAMFWKRNRNKKTSSALSAGSRSRSGTGVRQAGHQRGHPGPLYVSYRHFSLPGVPILRST